MPLPADLPGRPQVIVGDQGGTIQGGIRAHWGKDAYMQLVHLCESHLSVNARLAMQRDHVTPADEIWALSRMAFTSRDAWDAFEHAVNETPKATNTRRWMATLAEKMRAQTSRRPQIPPVYANGALEADLAKIRAIIEPRAFAYRNRARMDRMLEL